MFKKIQNYIFIGLFLSLIIGPSITWGLLTLLNNNDNKIMEYLDFDLNEKRNKATLSEPIDLSKVTYELDSYYNDRVPYRSILISTKRNIDTWLEIPYKNGIEKELIKRFSKKVERSVVRKIVEEDGKVLSYMDFAIDEFMNHALKKSEVDTYDDTVEFPLKYLNNSKVIMGQSDWLFLGELNIPYYTGEKNFKNESEIKEYIKPYEKLKKECDKVGKNLVIMICPEKEEIYPEYMPTLEIKDEVERPIKIRDYIASNSDVKYLYPKEELLKYKKNYMLYKKYDTHWNPVGAYIASNEIKKALNIDTIPLRKMKLEKVAVLDADLVFYANTSINNLPQTFTYKFLNYKKDSEVETLYVKDPLIHDSYKVHSTGGIDRKVFLIGDSFREATEEFLNRDFNTFSCNVYLNMKDDAVKEDIKEASDIVILLVERNEEVLLPTICEYIYDVLKKNENEINKLYKKNN